MPIMKPDSITIRPYLPSDAAAVYEAARESFAEVSPWMAWLNDDYTPEMAEAWTHTREDDWNKGIAHSFLIEDAAGQFLGAVGLNGIDLPSRRANFGYWVRTSAAGQGVATRASRLLIDMTFSESPPFPARLHRLEILVAVGNVRSHRVAQKLGAVREAVLRDRLWPDGQPQDAVMYSLLKSDPR